MNRKQAEHDRTVLPRIRELMAEGRSLRRIAQQLEDEGFPTARPGGRWTHIAVGRILGRAERTPPEEASPPPPQAEQPPRPPEQTPPPAEPPPAPTPPRQESAAQHEAALQQLSTRYQEALQREMGSIVSVTAQEATAVRHVVVRLWFWVAVGGVLLLGSLTLGTWGLAAGLTASIESKLKERDKLKVEIARSSKRPCASWRNTPGAWALWSRPRASSSRGRATTNRRSRGRSRIRRMRANGWPYSRTSEGRGLAHFSLNRALGQPAGPDQGSAGGQGLNWPPPRPRRRAAWKFAARGRAMGWLPHGMRTAAAASGYCSLLTPGGLQPRQRCGTRALDQHSANRALAARLSCSGAPPSLPAPMGGRSEQSSAVRPFHPRFVQPDRAGLGS